MKPSGPCRARRGSAARAGAVPRDLSRARLRAYPRELWVAPGHAARELIEIPERELVARVERRAPTVRDRGHPGCRGAAPSRARRGSPKTVPSRSSCRRKPPASRSSCPSRTKLISSPPCGPCSVSQSEAGLGDRRPGPAGSGGRSSRSRDSPPARPTNGLSRGHAAVFVQAPDLALMVGRGLERNDASDARPWQAASLRSPDERNSWPLRSNAIRPPK